MSLHLILQLFLLDDGGGGDGGLFFIMKIFLLVWKGILFLLVLTDLLLLLVVMRFLLVFLMVLLLILKFLLSLIFFQTFIIYLHCVFFLVAFFKVESCLLYSFQSHSHVSFPVVRTCLFLLFSLLFFYFLHIIL